VKLVREAIEAASNTSWRVAVVGEPRDPDLVALARSRGAAVLEAPDDSTYALAIAAADCVLVLRRGSVGETNGPLLDAIGARRAILATRGGSIPEVADGAAQLCDPDVASIAAGLDALASAARREELEANTMRRADELQWDASAQAHRSVFEEVFA
jgi:glycosyltransferase involved in cell wall biosynthesis